jgi:predicted RNA-binding Zn ribbon-like protein
MSEGAGARETWTFDLSGGRLCLDFVNSVGGMRGVSPKDHLVAYRDLVEFGRQTGSVSEPQARHLLAEARRRPADADAALASAIALREALYRLFVARARGGTPAQADLDLLSATLARALSHRRLTLEGDCCAYAWSDDPGALDAPLWPVAESAASLLTSGEELGRVRVCGLYDDEECSWLFIDKTRARTRRWCSMKDCGNRAKARRHHARAKGAEGS